MIWIEPSSFTLRVVDRDPGEKPPYRVLGNIMAPSESVAILVGLHGKIRPGEILEFYRELRLSGFDFLIAQRVGNHRLPYGKTITAPGAWQGWFEVDLSKFDASINQDFQAA